MILTRDKEIINNMINFIKKWWIVFLVIIVILMWLGLIPILYSVFPTMNDRALFGDMYGVINALFSALAFVGIVAAIHLQQKELSLQREELKYTRDELKRSALAQEKSEKIFEKNAKLYALSASLSYYLQCMDIEARMNNSQGLNGISQQSAFKILETILKIVKEENE